MHPILLEPRPAATNPDHALLLKESIDRFLAETQNYSSRDFSAFRSIFFRLIQSSADPPLEVLWFYSAVVHHDSISSKDAIFDRVLAVRDLLQLLITCSVCSSGAKSVAVVAPVVAELCRVVVELEGSGGKEIGRVRKEVDRLVEGVIGYISICSGKGWDGGDDGLLLLPELVRVWTVRQKDGGGFMRRFFPLVSEEVCGGFVGEKKGGLDYLAGVVIAEAFLLRLYLKFQVQNELRVARSELQNELRVWAVSSVTGFRNRTFFEILLSLLLESTLPSVFTLNPKDEAFLRTILCDAVLLVEYGFLQPKVTEQFYDCLKSLALTRLVVAHEAIQVARKSGDQGKAISYINAFSRSSLLLGLIKWITTHTGMSGSPNATTPQALLKWLLKLEEQGLTLFDLDILKYRIKFFDELDHVPEDQVLKTHSKNANDDLFFFDNEGEVAHDDSDDLEMELVDNAFVSAARSMNYESNGRRKRKEMKHKEGDSHVKFVKYKIHDSSAKEYFSASKEGGMSSGSEVDNPLSDEDMEEIET